MTDSPSSTEPALERPSPRALLAHAARAAAGRVRERLGGTRSYAGLWSPATMAQATAQIYDTTDMAAFEEGGRRDAAWLSGFFGPEATVLDLGCGIGRVAYYVAPECRRLWAVDVSPRMLELARGRLAGFDNVSFARCADVSVPDVPSGSVDLAYSLLVLQHVEREDAFLLVEELHRVLRPGGAATLTFPNLLSATYLEGFVAGARRRAGTQRNRARPYTPEEARVLVQAAGFSVEELDPGTEIRVVARA